MGIYSKEMTEKALAARADFEIDVEGYDFGGGDFLIGYNGGTAYFEMDARTIGHDRSGYVTEYTNATLIGVVYYNDDLHGADLVLSRDEISAICAKASDIWEAAALAEAVGE
jgi:hypothetical protein